MAESSQKNIGAIFKKEMLHWRNEKGYGRKQGSHEVNLATTPQGVLSPAQRDHELLLFDIQRREEADTGVAPEPKRK